MFNKLKRFLVYIFCAFFVVCFSYLLVNIFLKNGEYNYKKQTLAIYIVAVVSLLTFIYSRLSKHEAFFTKHYKKILVSFLSIMMIAQVSFGLLLRFTPDFDISAVYDGAIEWAQTGTFTSFFDYYYHFPNNLGAMTFFAYLLQNYNFIGD